MKKLGSSAGRNLEVEGMGSKGRTAGGKGIERERLCEGGRDGDAQER